MTSIVLLRHGVTDWNLEGRYQGQVDVPMNEEGREECAAALKLIHGGSIRRIHSSDLRRAQETASILGRAFNVSVTLDPRLREVHLGAWQGLLFPEILATYAEDFRRRQKDPLHAAPPGGETVKQLQKRVLEAMAEIVSNAGSERVLVVSHGLSLAVVRMHYEKQPLARLWDLIPPNAIPIEIDTDQS